MKKLEVGFMEAFPMYFTFKGKDGERFVDKVKAHDGSDLIKDNKVVMGNYANGLSQITVSHNDTLEVGDIITINKIEQRIESINETRKPKGVYLTANVMWYNLTCSYTRFIG